MDANALKFIFGDQKFLFEKNEIKSSLTSRFPLDTHTVIITPQRVNDTQLAFVQNILKACQLTDTPQFLTSPEIDIKSLRTIFPELKQILLFGVNFIDIGIDMKQKAIDYVALNGIHIISTPGIDELSTQPPMKNFLWQNILKPIYVS